MAQYLFPILQGYLSTWGVPNDGGHNRGPRGAKDDVTARDQGTGPVVPDYAAVLLSCWLELRWRASSSAPT